MAICWTFVVWCTRCYSCFLNKQRFHWDTSVGIRLFQLKSWAAHLVRVILYPSLPPGSSKHDFFQNSYINIGPTATLILIALLELWVFRPTKEGAFLTINLFLRALRRRNRRPCFQWKIKILTNIWNIYESTYFSMLIQNMIFVFASVIIF
jgi:hypothetical protein